MKKLRHLINFNIFLGGFADKKEFDDYKDMNQSVIKFFKQFGLNVVQVIEEERIIDSKYYMGFYFIKQDKSFCFPEDIFSVLAELLKLNTAVLKNETIELYNHDFRIFPHTYKLEVFGLKTQHKYCFCLAHIDLTKKNIIMKSGNCYLIDYESISFAPVFLKIMLLIEIDFNYTLQSFFSKLLFLVQIYSKVFEGIRRDFNRTDEVFESAVSFFYHMRGMRSLEPF